MAFAPTLMHANGDLDLDAHRTHVDYLSRAGVGSIVIAGGVGEFWTLDDREYRDLIKESVDAAGGRVTVLAGVGHSTAIAARTASVAAEVGANGLLVNPLYFVHPDLEGLTQHYRNIGDSSGLGLVIFSTTGSVYDEDALARIAEVDAAVAVKDEVGDLALFERCVAGLGDRYEWVNGMAEIPAYDYAQRGAVAMTSGLVNLAPEMVIELWEVALAGDRDRHEEIVTKQIRPLAELRTARPGYHITVIKEAMALLGRGQGGVRLPLVPLRPDEREQLDRVLRECGYADDERQSASA